MTTKMEKQQEAIKQLLKPTYTQLGIIAPIFYPELFKVPISRQRVHQLYKNYSTYKKI